MTTVGRAERLAAMAKRFPRRTSFRPDITARAHLDTIRCALRSDRSIAQILEVSPAQVTRWRRGQAPDIENADRLAGLGLVVEMLLRWLEPESIEGWLNGINVHLGDRTPVFMLQLGEVAEVIGAIQAEKAGVFG